MKKLLVLFTIVFFLWGCSGLGIRGTPGKEEDYSLEELLRKAEEAGGKWSDYGALTSGNVADSDDFLIRDVSDTPPATGNQKRFSWSSLKTDLGSADFTLSADIDMEMLNDVTGEGSSNYLLKDDGDGTYSFTNTLSVTLGGFTANRALETDGSGNLEVSLVTDTELALLDGKTDLASADGDVFTGVHDFGGATSFEFPNGTNPATANAGEGAVDTDDHFIEFFSNASVVVNAKKSETVILAEPDELQPINDVWTLKHFDVDTYPHGVTIVDLITSTSATCTDVIVYEEWTNNGTAWAWSADVESITLSGTRTEDDGTLADSSMAADAYLRIDLPASPTDIASYEVTFTYFINPGD